MNTRTVIVTRPEREAAQWLAALQAHGIAVCALPLIRITPITTPALDQARTTWQHYHAVMFVSANAVFHFFQNRQSSVLSRQLCTRLWAPGPGTAAALHQLGLPPDAIDSPPAGTTQFDSEALWLTVAAQIHPDTRILIVRGSDDPATPQGNGRRWLIQRLGQAEAHVDCVAAYLRCAPQLTSAQRTQACLAATDGSLWLFSSALAITHLQANLPQQCWQHAHALTTHPRIAQAAHAAGFGSIQTCRPTLSEVLTTIDINSFVPPTDCGTMPT